MSSKIEVQLTQYTPLLHFQGQQEGACLRASEVKPALDHFITAWLKKINKAAPPQWIQSEVNGHTAYRYRMTFTANGEPEHQKSQNNKPERPYFYMYKTTNSKGKMVVRGDIHQLFFAAMGDDAFDSNGESRIKGVFYPEGMTMMILVPGDQGNKLSALLKKLIPPFFALHCFGNRSNKGFGSFGVKEMDGVSVPDMDLTDLIQYTPMNALYFAEYDPNQISSGDAIDRSNEYLDDVFMLSNIMKSGINYTHGKTGENGDTSKTPYYKGMIFQYFLDEKLHNNKKIHSEKASIKKFVLNRGTEVEDNFVREHFYESFDGEIDCRFVRAIIGLPQQYEYRKDGRWKNGQYVLTNPHSRREGTIAVENKVSFRNQSNQDDQEPTITRYENPIHFKPYGNTLLIIPQEIPDKMKNQVFYLIKSEMNQERRNNRIVINAHSRYTKIRTPVKFDLVLFLDYCCEKYSIDWGSLLTKFRDNSRPSTTIRNALNRITSIEKAEPKAGDEHNG